MDKMLGRLTNMSLEINIIITFVLMSKKPENVWYSCCARLDKNMFGGFLRCEQEVLRIGPRQSF